MLTSEGFEVFVADSGRMAIDQLPHISPDLILLDVMMPGLDGFATCRQVKSDERWADVPLFFLTALTDTVDKVKGSAPGAVDYITKPLDADEVLARIGAHLDLRALQRALEEKNEFLDREIQRRIAAARALGHTLEDSILVVDHHGDLLFSTATVARLLQQHDLTPTRERLLHWFAHLESAEPRGLRIRRLPDPHSAERALLVLREEPPAPSPARLAVLGLTPREAEILFGIAQGKNSPEIATILDSAPATVKRHVHHILGKLGVETRLAAALKAMELLGPPS